MASFPEDSDAQNPNLAAKVRGITGLHPDVLVQILELLPDVDSLKNAVLASRAFYKAFSDYKGSITTTVLKNEIEPENYTHAVVENLVSRPQYLGIPSFELTDIDDIATYVREIQCYRDTAFNLRVHLRDAVRISRRAKMVTKLCDNLIGDCAYAKEEQYMPLWQSLLINPPMVSELVRVRQSIYLYEIVARLCRSWRFMGNKDRQYYVDCQDKITELHKSIVGQLMAPWEFHQVLAIQAYFRRFLHGFDKSNHQSERTMPDLLVRGIDFMHEALCVVGWKCIDEFLVPFEELAQNQPLHAFGMVVSRGVRDAWTRKPPKPYDDYKPFWDDSMAYEMWTWLEHMQLRYFRLDEEWNDFFSLDLRRLEGKLDLWSAALWNGTRRADMYDAFDPEVDFWQDMSVHWDPIITGFETILHPDVVL